MEIGKKIALKGESGNAYGFNVYPWKTRLVCSGVVYVVIRQNKIGYSILYVGCTGMFSGHISHHPLLAEFNEAGKTHVGIHIEPSVLMRHVKHRDLIKNFSPPLNKN